MAKVGFVAVDVETGIGVGGEEGRSGVGRSVVDEDDFEVLKGLGEDGVEGLPKGGGAVVGGDEDGNEGRHRGVIGGRGRSSENNNWYFWEITSKRVGAAGFEPATSSSQSLRSTRLSHAPTQKNLRQGRRQILVRKWRGRRDLNPQHPDRQSGTLTN